MDDSKNGTAGSTDQHVAATTNAAIDIEKLAEKVYQLMRAEIRLAQARGNERNKRK